MKIEIEDGAVLPVVLCTLTLCFTVIAVAAMAMHCYTVRQYTEHGYTRTTLPGCDYSEWVKEVK